MTTHTTCYLRCGILNSSSVRLCAAYLNRQQQLLLTAQTQHRRRRRQGSSPDHTAQQTRPDQTSPGNAPMPPHAPDWLWPASALWKNNTLHPLSPLDMNRPWGRTNRNRIRYVSGIACHTTCCADDVKALGICKFLNTILVAINKANKQDKQARQAGGRGGEVSV